MGSKVFNYFLFSISEILNETARIAWGGWQEFFFNLYSTIFDHDLFPIIFFKFNFTINFLDAKALFVKKNGLEITSLNSRQVHFKFVVLRTAVLVLADFTMRTMW